MDTGRAKQHHASTIMRAPWTPPPVLPLPAAARRIGRMLRTRRFPRCVVTACALGLVTAPLAAQRAVLDPDVVRARLEARIAAVPGAEVSVTIVNLGTGSQLSLDGDRVYHAASTMKVPVLIDLLREADAGRLSLDQSILLVNAFHSIVDGSPYALSAADDSDSTVYARVGEWVPVRWLAERMINHSSNLATNALIALLDPERITATMRTLGAERTLVLRGVEDGPAFRAGRNNVTTSDDLAAILKAIERREAASPAATEFLLATLRAQAFNDQIPAGLPPGTPVAHKTGQITATLHDAAIIYPPGRAPFVLVILTRGIPEQRVAERLTAELSAIAWEWLGAPLR
jgi:beta-lactamase class A